jgi:hypothetical protein
LIDIILSSEYFVIAFIAGIIGALFGIGGGIIIVPTLTLILGMDIHLAIGASIVSVVATSVAATGTYVKEDIVNMRLGMFLEMGTSSGALFGAFLAIYLQNKVLFLIFSLVLLYASYIMYQSSKIPEHLQFAPKNDWLATKFHLDGIYSELHSNSNNEKEKASTHYYVQKTPQVFGISIGAGIASGLLGVGGGFIKVPALVNLSRLPMKAASSTSNFMIGVTAATSALVYLKNGYVNPVTAIPIAFGTLLGALLGSILIRYLHPTKLRTYFALLLIFVSIRLFFQAFG